MHNFIYLFIYWCIHSHGIHVKARGQLLEVCSVFPLWVVRIQFESLALIASAFPCWTILLVLNMPYGGGEAGNVCDEV